MAKKAAKKAVAPTKKAAPKSPAPKAKKEESPKKAAVKTPKAEAKPEAKPAKVATTEAPAKAKEKPTKTPKVAVAADDTESTPVVKPIKISKREEAKAQKILAAANAEEKIWNDLFEKHKAEKPQPYDMKLTFEAGKPLQHKVLGWGWIVSNDNDRLEVLFKDGKRILISNYNR